MTKQQEQLVEENMNLVYFTIARYYPQCRGNDDIIQIGMMGLCKAAKLYDESKGAFSTYAIRKIRGEICGEFRKETRRIKTISLDSECNTTHGEAVTLQEFIVGDEDEGYVDLTPLHKALSPQQRAVFDLLQQGLTLVTIGKQLGISHQRVNQLLRIIQKKWSKIMDK